MSSHPNSDRAAGGRAKLRIYEIPGWVKIFGIVAVIAVVIFAALHRAGGGMKHMDHDNMGAQTLPAEHGQDVP